MRRYVLDVAGWKRQREFRMIGIASAIDSALVDEGKGTIGTIPIEIRVGTSCAGCEKDDRREWTEPAEHTCAKEKS